MGTFDLIVLVIGCLVLAGEHAAIRYAPNLVRYSAGTLVILGITCALLWQHGAGSQLWIPLLAVVVSGAATAGFFVFDAARDIWRLWRAEGPMPLPAFIARLIVLYRRTHGEG